MGVLDEILKKKRQRLAAAKSLRPLGELRAAIRDAERPRDFAAAVKATPGEGIRLIAEVKRASPSAGLLREDFSPRGIALIYRDRAHAVSVLTEEDFFMGSLDHIREVKEASGRPVLRKDFLFDEYQIYEARAASADAVLLINEVLGGAQAAEYMHMASELGMAAIYEIHDLRGLEQALKIDAAIIGINNRDLRTMKTDINTTFEIKKEMPAVRTLISESGIHTREDVLRLEEAGVDAMLVGTAFMRAQDIGARMDELLGKEAPG